jgi:3-oxoacid CoA-transferase B subunit
MIDTSSQPTSLMPGASFYKTSDSFNIIRGGHVNITFMGALQVSSKGDVSNWSTKDFENIWIGGEMDRVAGKQKLIVCMTHLN